MTQEDKDLLLKDLCARLPYGVKVQDTYYKNLEPAPIWLLDLNAQSVRKFADEGYQHIEYIKPYLFPLSSMTEEQQEEFDRIYADDMQVVANNLKNRLDGKPYETNLGHYRHIDWLNANHFDYRGLIPKGLAIDVTGLNIY